MLFGLFDKFSLTGVGKQYPYPPIALKVSSKTVFDILSKYVKEEGYYNIKCNSEYLDIYFQDGGYEISYLLGQDETGHATLNITVYGEHKRGRTQRKLKSLIKLTKQVLNNYLE